MRHAYTLASATQEMAVWTGEEEPEMMPWGTYTDLGPFVPKRPRRGAVYATRRDHNARHFPKLRRGSIARWARSTAREIGEFWVGAFQPVKEAF